MDKYGVWDSRPESTPYRPRRPKLEPSLTLPDEAMTFDYAMCLGDLAWYSRTNPGLSFVVHELSRSLARPGPEHVEAAHHVLRYILGHLGAGLTYHGGRVVLGRP